MLLREFFREKKHVVRIHRHCRSVGDGGALFCSFHGSPAPGHYRVSRHTSVASTCSGTRIKGQKCSYSTGRSRTTPSSLSISSTARIPPPPKVHASSSKPSFPPSSPSAPSTLHSHFNPSPSSMSSSHLTPASSLPPGSPRPLHPPSPPPPPPPTSSFARPLSFPELLDEVHERSLERYLKMLLSLNADKHQHLGKDSFPSIGTAPALSPLDTTAFTQAFGPLRQFTLHLVHAVFQDVMPALLRRAHYGGGPYQGVDVDALRMQTRWDRRHGAQLGDLREVIHAFEFVFFRVERESTRKEKEDGHRVGEMKKKSEFSGKMEHFSSTFSSSLPSVDVSTPSSSTEYFPSVRVFAYPSAPSPHVLYARLIARLFPSSLGFWRSMDKERKSPEPSRVPSRHLFSSVGNSSFPLPKCASLDSSRPGHPSSSFLPVTFPMAFIGEALAWGRLFAPLCGPLPRLLSLCGRKTEKAQLLPTRQLSVHSGSSVWSDKHPPLPSPSLSLHAASKTVPIQPLKNESELTKMSTMERKISDSEPYFESFGGRERSHSSTNSSSRFSEVGKDGNGVLAVGHASMRSPSEGQQQHSCVIQFGHFSKKKKSSDEEKGKRETILPPTSCCSSSVPAKVCTAKRIVVMREANGVEEDICWLLTFDLLSREINRQTFFEKGQKLNVKERGGEKNKKLEKRQEKEEEVSSPCCTSSSSSAITVELLLQAYCAIFIFLTAGESSEEHLTSLFPCIKMGGRPWPHKKSKKCDLVAEGAMLEEKRRDEEEDAVAVVGGGITSMGTESSLTVVGEGVKSEAKEMPQESISVLHDVIIHWNECYLEEETAEKKSKEEVKPRTVKQGDRASYTAKKGKKKSINEDCEGSGRKRHKVFGKEKVASSLLSYLLHRFPLQLRLCPGKSVESLSPKSALQARGGHFSFSASPVLQLFGYADCCPPSSSKRSPDGFPFFTDNAVDTVDHQTGSLPPSPPPFFSLCPLSLYIIPHLFPLPLRSFPQGDPPSPTDMADDRSHNRKKNFHFSPSSAFHGDSCGVSLEYLKNEVLEWDYFTYSSTPPSQCYVITKGSTSSPVERMGSLEPREKQLHAEGSTTTTTTSLPLYTRESGSAGHEAMEGGREEMRRRSTSTVLHWMPPMYYHPALRALVHTTSSLSPGVGKETEGRKVSGVGVHHHPQQHSTSHNHESELSVPQRDASSLSSSFPISSADGQHLRWAKPSFSLPLPQHTVLLSPVDGLSINAVLFRDQTPSSPAASSVTATSSLGAEEVFGCKKGECLWHEEEEKCYCPAAPQVHHVKSCGISLLSVLWAYTRWEREERGGARHSRVPPFLEANHCRACDESRASCDIHPLDTTMNQTVSRGRRPVWLTRSSMDGLTMSIPLPCWDRPFIHPPTCPTCNAVASADGLCAACSWSMGTPSTDTIKKKPSIPPRPSFTHGSSACTASALPSPSLHDVYLFRTSPSAIAFSGWRHLHRRASFFSDDASPHDLVKSPVQEKVSSPLPAPTIASPCTRPAKSVTEEVEEGDRLISSCFPKKGGHESRRSGMPFSFEGFPSLPMSVTEAIRLVG